MIPKEMLNDALSIFLANPHWKMVYETVPSDRCRERLRLMFCWSVFDVRNDEEVNKYRDRIDESLNIADWRYLQKYGGHNPFYRICWAHINELEAKQKSNK